MKIIRRLVLLSCAVLAAPSYAQTFSNNWSYIDDVTGQTVSGTVSGLMNGTDLSAEGLTFIVTQAPFADLLGDYTVDEGPAYSGDKYSASDGVVTRLDVYFENAALNRLFWLGTSGFLQGTNYPDIQNGAGEEVRSLNVGATFSAVVQEDGDVPEPASWVLMVAGFGLAGAGLRRQRTAPRAA